MEQRVKRAEERQGETAPGARSASLALTLDDAPSVLPRGEALEHDPSRMDRVREVLLEEGVADCVAFVTGQAAEDHEAPLSRWLESGYELGNHTHDHPRCSAVSTSSFLESLDRCDRFLEALGAFEGGRQRWLRFPYLDRGADPDTRAELMRALADRGYRAACASTRCAQPAGGSIVRFPSCSWLTSGPSRRSSCATSSAGSSTRGWRSRASPTPSRTRYTSSTTGTRAARDSARATGSATAWQCASGGVSSSC
ncbi:MAG: polysaccharide deacetylase family protein [Planctomycetota bacterium]